MEKYFVSYAQAVVLKELGFDEECFGYFDGNNNFRYTSNGEPKKFSNMRMGVSNSVLVGWVSAPLKTQVFEWFQTKHNLYVDIVTDRTMEPKFCYEIHKFIEPCNWDNSYNGYSDLFYRKDKCESALIDKLIKKINKRGL